MLNKLSLKRRLTFFVATILIIIAIILTSMTIASVKTAMIPLINSANMFDFISGNDIFYNVNSGNIYFSLEDAIDDIENEDKTNTNNGGMYGHGRMNNRNHMNKIMEKNIASNIRLAQQQVSKNSLYTMFGIIVFGILGAYIIIDRSLRPLTKLSETIHEIGEDNLNTQIAVPEPEDEISSLIISFNKMLQRLEIMFKGQKDFSAKAAHELRTPLTTMKTSLQVLQIDDSPSVDEYRENIGLMEENINRLIDIVNNLFLLSSESIKINDNIIVDSLIYKLLEEKEEDLKDKNIDLKLSLGKIEFPGNKELVYSAISNILENAIKYNIKDGSIFIRAFKTVDGMANIKIEDSGIGIKEEELDKIFDAFYRVDDNKVDGNGLGLSIVKNIVEEHNGKIEIESVYGEGTNIQLSFPLYTNTNK